MTPSSSWTASASDSELLSWRPHAYTVLTHWYCHWQVITVDTVHFTTATQRWLQSAIISANHNIHRVDGSPVLASWVIVVGYYPVVSDGKHGDAMANTNLLTILSHFGVTAYVSGADRNLQHIEQHGFHHFVAGASQSSTSSRLSLRCCHPSRCQCTAADSERHHDGAPVTQRSAVGCWRGSPCHFLFDGGSP